MTSTVVIAFKSFRDEDTGQRCLEAKAIDPETHLPVVSMSLQMLAAWLRLNRYRYVTGTSGVWQRAA